MKKNSKRYNEILKNAIKDKRVSAKEALELVKKNSTAKFDESIDVSLKINLKLRKKQVSERDDKNITGKRTHKIGKSRLFDKDNKK